jgi:hypothetical protein
MNALLLGGDIGGTKTLLALASVGATGIVILREQRYVSTGHEGLEALLDDFLAGGPIPAAACFGVAGPTDGQTADLTYLPWHLSAPTWGSASASGMSVWSMILPLRPTACPWSRRRTSCRCRPASRWPGRPGSSSAPAPAWG